MILKQSDADAGGKDSSFSLSQVIALKGHVQLHSALRPTESDILKESASCD